MGKILVTNDDGIRAEGIRRLAEMAKELGEVWVVAPEQQCSAMSQKITVSGQISVRKAPDFPVEGVKAYCVGGTPADCVKIAVEHLMEEKPDWVFSGINFGYNAGLEVSYSGTVAAAMEGIQKQIPAIAFSTEANRIYDVVDQYLLKITKELMEKNPGDGKIWNVNFPGCTVDECKGILYDRKLANTQFYLDHYDLAEERANHWVLNLNGKPIVEAGETSDLGALLERFVSIGTITNVIYR